MKELDGLEKAMEVLADARLWERIKRRPPFQGNQTTNELQVCYPYLII
jgi:hypothetical protein